jgi:thiol-disulfide isomerase/thioredoxin
VVHDQSIAIGELRMAAELGVAEDLGIALSVPLRLLDTSIRYLDDGRTVDIAAENIHHRNETLAGIADPWLLAHMHKQWGRTSIDLRAGASLPLGRTEEDPFALGEAGLPHQHVQFGAGTLNPIAGAEVHRDFGRMGLRLYALTVQSLYDSGKGYQAGDRYQGGVAALSPLGTRAWRFEAGLEGLGETAERWNGMVHDDDGNRGRFDLLVAGSAGRALGGGFEGYVGVKVPVVTHTVGGQLEYPILLEVAVSRQFEIGAHHDDHGAEADHHDDHDHGGDHAAAGDHGEDGEHASGEGDAGAADIADLTDRGEAVELTAVAGKVTVFDFWATWCAPCIELDDKLRHLAARYPDRLAIRRVNVVDWDSPAAEWYLTPGGFNLPHLKVLRADGTIGLEKSAPPAQLIRDLERLLAE